MKGYSEVRLTEFRRELHKYPELSGEEVQTAIRISRFLHTTSPDRLITGLGGRGIAAVYHGDVPGITVMFRCEMDALPIEEANEYSYRSSRRGAGHMCGHDGHMAMVCGLGILLSGQRPRQGTVVLLFQPAEETGDGARKILEHPEFAHLRPDYIFAIHNLPGFPKHSIIVKEGLFTGSVISVVIRLKGKKAHAAEPMRGNNPANAVAAIIERLRQAEMRDPGDPAFRLLTPVHIQMGSIAYGISADEAELHYTLRCRTEAQLKELESYTEEEIQQIADNHGLEVALEWTQRFFATRNDATAVRMIREAAAANQFKVTEITEPFNWGEDFGLFVSEIPGALFGLGAGKDAPALHQPDYDFPDDIIGTGVEMLRAVMEKTLQYDVDQVP